MQNPVTGLQPETFTAGCSYINLQTCGLNKIMKSLNQFVAFQAK